MEKKKANRGHGEPRLSPARVSGDSVEHTCHSALGGNGEDAGTLFHQLPISHWLKTVSLSISWAALLASWCTGSYSKEKKVFRQRVAGIGSQAAFGVQR